MKPDFYIYPIMEKGPGQPCDQALGGNSNLSPSEMQAMRPALRVFASVLLLSVSAACPQRAGAAQFEVASIKPAAPGEVGMYVLPGPGGGIRITNMTLKEMIVWAWRMQPFQISGGPSWLDSVHYDVVAKPESKPTRSELAQMLQALLKDRFQLTSHTETKELPVYALVLAKKDGKFGPGLKEAKDGSCTPPDPSVPPGLPLQGGPPSLSCGQFMMNATRFTAVSIPLSRMIPMLSRTLGRVLLDKTGLSGNFDITVQWTPDQNPGLRFSADASNLGANTDGPSIFTAFQEQLGLKLESANGPVEIFVVDRAEKPSEN
jgi:uncharacterized protein (TIGR03435 family)